MSIQAQRSKNGIQFTLSGVVCQQITAWEHTVDKRVFEEQLETGLFRGRPLGSKILEVMRAAKQAGAVVPYYGAGGSRGAAIYTLQPTNEGYRVQVENAETGDAVVYHTLDRSASVKDALKRALRTVRSLLPALSEKAGTPHITLKIDGQEYENLIQWAYWSDKEAFTSRYIYRFGRVSLGRLGYTVKVEDTLTGNSIDVTDYADW